MNIMGGEIITTEADRIFLAGEEQGLQQGERIRLL